MPARLRFSAMKLSPRLFEALPFACKCTLKLGHIHGYVVAPCLGSGCLSSVNILISCCHSNLLGGIEGNCSLPHMWSANYMTYSNMSYLTWLYSFRLPRTVEDHIFQYAVILLSGHYRDDRCISYH